MSSGSKEIHESSRANDITEMKLADAEHELLLIREKQLREAAEAANRSKDEFIAVVTHELRAPLNAILGWAQALERETDEVIRLRIIQAIERNARAQSKLIEDLLDNSRILSGQLKLEIQPLHLIGVINNALDVVRPAAAAKAIKIKTDFQIFGAMISGDHDRLQQVIWNLLSNAIKFTEAGGEILIILERVDPYLRITIEDTGRGIKLEDQPLIFSRFHQIDEKAGRRRSGLGLGLALVKHLVELHGGDVDVFSEGLGKGSSFIINLPIRALSADSEANGAKLSPQRKFKTKPEVLKGLRILIVDDETDARELLTTLLKQYGASVIAASSAQEAIGILSSAPETERPDVLVSDIGMPLEDGYSLIGKVRRLPFEEGGQIPAIALTAFSRAQDRVRALSSGFQMHLPKPVEQLELVTVISSLTGRIVISDD